MKFLKILQTVGFFFGLVSSIKSFRVFYRNIDKLNTPEEWKFYASLAGFSIFFLMFLFLIITLIASNFMKNVTKKFEVH